MEKLKFFSRKARPSAAPLTGPSFLVISSLLNERASGVCTLLFSVGVPRFPSQGCPFRASGRSIFLLGSLVEEAGSLFLLFFLRLAFSTFFWHISNALPSFFLCFQKTLRCLLILSRSFFSHALSSSSSSSIFQWTLFLVVFVVFFFSSFGTYEDISHRKPETRKRGKPVYGCQWRSFFFCDASVSLSPC